MTRTLVLTVDRDNDLGIKTAIRGPVVGRRQVLTAALNLELLTLRRAILMRYLGHYLSTTI